MHLEHADAYVKELDAWHDLIGRQQQQLPDLTAMLDRTLLDRREADDEMLTHAETLRQAIRAQGDCMQRLREALSLQIDYLRERSNGRKKGFGLRTVSRQERLRDEVRNVQRRYFELKSSLMNYVWSVSWRH